MSLSLDDTIVALASAPGGSYEGIIRLSGPRVEQVLDGMLAKPLASFLTNQEGRIPASVVVQAEFRLPEARTAPATIYWWRTERSYTRQPLAEVYLPGSSPLLDLAVRRLCAAGARLARPGEFTLRAFLAGRLDLPQAEAVLGVIEARDQQELETALTQLAGGLSHRLAEVRNQLLDLLAHLEAGLDFVDEDIEFITREELQRQVDEGAALVEQVSRQLAARSETSGTMPRVVLLGEPNAGKSSLLNALAGAEAAIVSPIAGTTRDYLSRVVAWGNQPVQLIDTAGIEAVAADDSIDAVAQTLGKRQHEQADVQLVCLDGSQPLSPAARSLLTQPSIAPRVIVFTKGDLPPVLDREALPSPALLTSAATGAGLEELRQAITAALARSPSETRVVAATAVRCQASLQAAAASLAAAAELVRRGASEEWIAAELRLALDELGQVIGAVYTDDILDRVFSRFCIGK
jgi:tRNA modification GTPase